MTARLSTTWHLRWLSALIVSLFFTHIPAHADDAIAGDPLAASLQALVKEGVHPKLRWGKFTDYQPALEQLYQQSAYHPIWTRDGQAIPQVASVLTALDGARAQGFDPADYDAETLRHWAHDFAPDTKPHPQNVASFDVALSLSVMRYASNLYLGRINPRHVNFGLDIEPKKQDLPALIKRIADSSSPEEIFSGLEPKLKLYEHLKAALSHYQTLAKNAPNIQINLPAKFKPGDRHPDVPALRRLLVLLGDLPESKHTSETYDAELAEGVKRFQLRHGLGADGVIGKGTLAQLNFPLSERLQQIQLGLERLRWLPERIDGRYLIVNIPSFQLFGFNHNHDKPDIEMNVIVGEAIDGRNTPVFHADMTYVNFRPYWNVPYKITAKEFVPQILRNPGYLGRNNLEIVANFAPNSPVYEPSLGNVEMLSTGALKLRQKPGPKNALGLVKFAFPNNNNVYLHSTPTQGLFKKARRDFSHGCIRVENPQGLADWVLREQGEWPMERIEETMKGDKTKTVTLKTALPVYIFYSTVLADESGRVMFFDDLYGHDRILQDLLAKGFPYPA
ncbi:murein L,D-transpeptidase [Methylococcus sp. EFPC2]|uniref:L,D-transpeptidase family protein n=1 Tax=Methylococcus sp. EFPC2 TaxID=2812648 RepID=UPI0019672A27|nr:L,D-transpeptidase family protein [Methylococcus sp. EFPC2]QSA95655.1 L,D-transpeptidase family protein [Methylococcus sp. EFPC2]